MDFLKEGSAECFKKQNDEQKLVKAQLEKGFFDVFGNFAEAIFFPMPFCFDSTYFEKPHQFSTLSTLSTLSTAHLFVFVVSG